MDIFDFLRKKNIEIFELENMDESWIVKVNYEKIIKKSYSYPIIESPIDISGIKITEFVYPPSQFIKMFYESVEVIEYITENCKDIRGIADIKNNTASRSLLNEFAIFRGRELVLCYTLEPANYLFMRYGITKDDIRKAMTLILMR